MATGNQALFAILMLMTAPNKVMPSNVSCDCLSMQALMMMVQHLTTMTEQQASTIQAMQSQMTSLQTSVHQQSSAASDHIATLAGVGSRPNAGVNDANKKRLGTKASGTGKSIVVFLYSASNHLSFSVRSFFSSKGSKLHCSTRF